MKKIKYSIRLASAPLIILAFLCLSCNSQPSNNKTRSWLIPAEQEISGTVCISGIEAETTGARSFIENEAAGLLTLLLLDHKYLVLDESENADFIAEVKIREREYIKGWKTVCSMGVEVYFYPGNAKVTKAGVTVPLAAAYASRESSGGFSSSKNLRNLLESALRQAVEALEKRSDA